MKNASNNESISFESTLGSPSKPPQNNIVQKPKQIFLVNCVEDNISLTATKINSSESLNKKSLKQKRPKSTKANNKKNSSIKNNKNIEFHLLDFDAIFKNIIIGKKKPVAKKAYKSSHISKNKAKMKLLGYKRNRLFLNKTSVNKKANLKKKKLNINTISKAKSINNNNSCSRYDIYDINNFCSNTMKIKEKSISHNVLVPSFEELSDDFFEDNNIEDYEDISDNNYLKYHNIFEQKEIDYRAQVSHNLDKKKSKKEIKKEIIETQKAYKNLYSTDNIDISGVNNLLGNESNKASSLNIIKIHLESLEFEKSD